MKLRLLAVTTSTVLLTACALPVAKINAPFDVKQASIINKEGKNTIAGSALMRQQGGGTVTCAGNEVTLTPATAYATERIMYIYKNTNKGVAYSGYKFEPDEPEYLTYTKNTQCGAQGNFIFKNIADGEYFVTTKIQWTVGYNVQGGALMRKVSVKGGETADIVLAP